jgi:hypothetical protein
MRNPKGKTHIKKRVQYDVYNKLRIKETLPLILANLEVNSYQCTQHIRNVEYGRFCEYLNRFSQDLVCKCSYARIAYGTEPF